MNQIIFHTLQVTIQKPIHTKVRALPYSLVRNTNSRLCPVESFPRGYPSLAAFLSSDKEFTVFRCFSRLHTRVLLHKQDELAQLEKRLDELDEEDSRNNSYRLLTNRHRGGDQDRRVLLGEIERKLNEYSKSKPAITGKMNTKDKRHAVPVVNGPLRRP